ncbi:hypothetical protein [Plantactinospora endophytica]|uniref:Uncharacterized protein n=1 Tax=Plantactinospora endophytica TaxID=673535 RepID=A0ABQ4E7P6_9ACTN|nr:hypothetical protein [Plantactinospora endophytica]GIG90734.1 hypothetical protein Pen02_56700 [Plantactinospora endophytica]
MHSIEISGPMVASGASSKQVRTILVMHPVDAAAHRRASAHRRGTLGAAATAVGGGHLRNHLSALRSWLGAYLLAPVQLDSRSGGRLTITEIPTWASTHRSPAIPHGAERQKPQKPPPSHSRRP